MTPKVTYAYAWVEDQIRVDAAVKCDRRFEGVDWIVSSNSANPFLRLDKPLGIRAVKVILDRTKVGFAAPTT